jgi:hypothetical protein
MGDDLEVCSVLMLLRTLFTSLLSLLFVFFATLFLTPDLKRISIGKKTALSFKNWKLKEDGGGT